MRKSFNDNRGFKMNLFATSLTSVLDNKFYECKSFNNIFYSII